MINRIRELLGLCVHDWSKWELGEETWGNYNAPIYGAELIDTFKKIKQTRRCKNCGEYEKKYMK